MLCILATALFPSVANGERQPDKLPWLTADEQVWLKEHPVIRLAPAPNFPPIERLDAGGNYQGLAADYIDEIEALLGIKFQIAKYNSWQDVIIATLDGKVDMWAAAADTTTRRDYMHFISPYLSLPAVIITRRDEFTRTNLKDLKDYKIAAVEGYATIDFLKSKYPKHQIKLVKSIEVGLLEVAYGSSDALVEANAPAIYYIEKNGLTNLHVSGKSGFSWELSMAVRKDWPELASILDKSTKQISADRKREIYRYWIPIQFSGWQPTSTFFAALALFLFALSVAGFVWRNRSLRTTLAEQSKTLKQQLQKQEESEQAMYAALRRQDRIFNSVAAPLILLKPDGAIVDMNETALALLEVSRADLPGLGFAQDLSAPRVDKERLVEEWQEAQSGKRKALEWQGVRKISQEELTLSLSIKVLALEKETLILATAKDINPDRQRQSEETAQLQKFGARLSILNGEAQTSLESYSRQHQNGADSNTTVELSKQKQILHQIERCYSDYIDVQLLRRKNFPCKKQSVDLNSISAKIEKETKELSKEYNIELTGKILADDIFVQADSRLLTRATKSIFLHAFNQANETSSLSLISDKDEAFGHLTLSYYEKSADSEKTGSDTLSSVIGRREISGFELSLAEGLITHMGGKFELETTPGMVSVIRISLPAAEQPPKS